MWTVYMSFPDDEGWYKYGSYKDRDRANEVAMKVRDERECWVKVVEEN